MPLKIYITDFLLIKLEFVELKVHFYTLFENYIKTIIHKKLPRITSGAFIIFGFI